ncbi:MAG TPA: hypothetical protein VKS98_06295 [Chthoniobacterales bacterium]|nr:hypothetical protein [Chthoniobacterales bacterium]
MRSSSEMLHVLGDEEGAEKSDQTGTDDEVNVDPNEWADPNLSATEPLGWFRKLNAGMVRLGRTRQSGIDQDRRHVDVNGSGRGA